MRSAQNTCHEQRGRVLDRFELLNIGAPGQNKTLSKKLKQHKKPSIKIKITSSLRRETHKVPGGSDDWETPKSAYEEIKTYVEAFKKNHIADKNLVIWDPFYSKGGAKDYLSEVFSDAKIIHKDKRVDLDSNKVPEFAKTANLIITNPPYSGKLKAKTTEWLHVLGIPFMSLMPVDAITNKNWRETLKDATIQLIVPSGRVKFESESGLKQPPQGSAWYCKGIGLENDLTLL
tara:strand:+ start:441 stop:1136 length:696 start_codon:yes stop_codon:yes gene_type:complete